MSYPYDIHPVEKATTQGIVLVQPMYCGQEHFSGYLIDAGFYSDVHHRIIAGVERELEQQIPESMGPSERRIRLNQLGKHIRGVRAARIHHHKGVTYFSFPNNHVLFTRGTENLDGLEILPETRKIETLDTLDPVASFIPAFEDGTPEHSLYLATRGALREWYTTTLDEEIARVTRRILLHHWQRVVGTFPEGV